MRVLAMLLATAWLLCACSPGPQQPAAASKRLLVLSPPGIPVVEDALQAIQAYNAARAPGSPAVVVDFRNVGSMDAVRRVMKERQPHLAAYSAIFCPSQSWSRVAQLMAPQLPLVFDGVDDPVEACLVDSLRRPGRNATGHMHMLPDTEAKMLQVLHQGYPALGQVVVLAAGDNIPAEVCRNGALVPRSTPPACRAGLYGPDENVQRLLDAQGIAALGQTLGLTVRFLVTCGPADFAAIGAVAAADKTMGFLVPWHSMFDDNVQALTTQINQTQRPAIYPNQRFTSAGGLMAIEPLSDPGPTSPTVLALMQVLDGRSPATLPVQDPRGFQLTLNARAAAQQGLQPSLPLLHRVDRIVPPQACPRTGSASAACP